MALPKLNDVPKYNITIPSSGKKTKFRPYLVKEEKVLLIALESGDAGQISQAAVDVIKACVDLDINEQKLTEFDVEYLFLKIRSKSVGETINVNLPCKDCDELNPVEINIDSVKVEFPDDSKKLFSLTDSVKVEMDYVSYYELTNNDILKNPESYADFIFELIAKSIKTVLTEDERINVKEEPEEEIINFLNQLNTQQFNQLRSFVENAPAISKIIEFKCENCDTDNTFILKGLNDFFA